MLAACARYDPPRLPSSVRDACVARGLRFALGMREACPLAPLAPSARGADGRVSQGCETR
jgi:hypothetical protein